MRGEEALPEKSSESPTFRATYLRSDYSKGWDAGYGPSCHNSGAARQVSQATNYKKRKSNGRSDGWCLSLKVRVVPIFEIRN